MCEWQRLRTRINHDWLKNEYLKNLDGLIIQIKSSQSIENKLCRELQAYLKRWSERHGEIEKLLNTAEKGLSPRTLFEKEPLIRCTRKNKDWLAPLIHGLWLSRHDIRKWVKETETILTEANQSHALLQSYYSVTQDELQILKTLEIFSDLVGDLSRQISKFPGKVITV